MRKLVIHAEPGGDTFYNVFSLILEWKGLLDQMISKEAEPHRIWAALGIEKNTVNN